MLSISRKIKVKKLNKNYDEIVEQAMIAQKKGDIRAFAKLTDQALTLREHITRLEKPKTGINKKALPRCDQP